MESINGQWRIREANASSFFNGGFAEVSEGEGLPRRPSGYDRFSARRILSEGQARTVDSQFPTRMLSQVSTSIAREPARAVEAQGNFSMRNVSALLELM